MARTDLDRPTRSSSVVRRCAHGSPLLFTTKETNRNHPPTADRQIAATLLVSEHYSIRCDPTVHKLEAAAWPHTSSVSRYTSSHASASAARRRALSLSHANGSASDAAAADAAEAAEAESESDDVYVLSLKNLGAIVALEVAPC